MHTFSLTDEDFEVVVDGEPAGLESVLPEHGLTGRLGVVISSPLGGLGASGLVLGAVKQYYDAFRAAGLTPPSYPEVFAVHVGRMWGDHSMLDIWPTRREVLVEDVGAVVETVEDLALTVLAVPDGATPPEPAAIGDAAVGDAALSAPAAARLRTCLAYSPTGRVHEADVSVAVGERTDEWLRHALDPRAAAASARAEGAEHYPYAASIEERATEVSADDRAACTRSYEERRRGSWNVETYRRISQHEAVALAGACPADGGC